MRLAARDSRLVVIAEGEGATKPSETKTVGRAAFVAIVLGAGLVSSTSSALVAGAPAEAAGHAASRTLFLAALLVAALVWKPTRARLIGGSTIAALVGCLLGLAASGERVVVTARDRTYPVENDVGIAHLSTGVVLAPLPGGVTPDRELVDESQRRAAVFVWGDDDGTMVQWVLVLDSVLFEGEDFGVALETFIDDTAAEGTTLAVERHGPRSARFAGDVDDDAFLLGRMDAFEARDGRYWLSTLLVVTEEDSEPWANWLEAAVFPSR